MNVRRENVQNEQPLVRFLERIRKSFSHDLRTPLGSIVNYAAVLEAMQIAASLLMKENALLAEPRGNSTDKGDVATLRARYTGLVKMAEETQALIDKLHAEEHDTKYHR